MELTLEQLREMVMSTVKDNLSHLTKVDRKYGAFPGIKEEDIAKMSWQEKFKSFLRAMVSGNVIAMNEAAQSWGGQKAMTEGQDVEGGYLVPEEFRAEIIRLIPRFGILRRFARRIPMTTEILRVPRQTAGVSITWPGESRAGTARKPSLGQVVLQAKKAMGLATLSNELLADAGVDVIAYLQEIFAEAFAEEEDNQLWNGTGAPFVGVLKDPDVKSLSMAATKTAFSQVTIDNLYDLFDQVEEEADADAQFYFHKNIITILRKLKDNNGQYLWSPAAQGNPGTIMGIPYATSKKLPGTAQSAPNTPFIVYGNLRHVLLGDRQEMTIALATEATIGSENLFEQDLRGLRITERISIQIAIPVALAYLKTAAS